MTALGRRLKSLVLTLTLVPLLGACANGGSSTSGVEGGSAFFTSDGSQGIDLNASNRCFVQDPGVDGCGIGGTEKTREALGYSLLRLKDAIARIRLGAGHALLCRAAGQNNDTPRSKHCRSFVLQQIEKFYKLTHQDTFTFEPRKNMPGGATFLVYLRDDGGQHTVYYDQAAVAGMDAAAIDRGLGHELGHFISLPKEIAPLGYYRDNDAVANYEGVNNAGALLLSDIGTGYARVAQDNSGYQGLVLSSKPETFLRLRETSGVVAADSSGKGNSGQLSGTYRLAQTGPLVQDQGIESLALELNGGLLSLNLPKIERPETTAVSVEFWMLTNPNREQVVASFSVANLRLYGLNIGFNTFMADLFGVVSTPSILQAWTHVVSVWRAHADQNELYLNGVRQDAKTMSAPDILPASMPDHRLFFGQQTYSPSEVAASVFSGRLAEIAVYLRPLSGVEAYRNYVLGANRLDAQPLYGTPDVTSFVESNAKVDPADNDLITQYVVYSPVSSSMIHTQLLDTPLNRDGWQTAGSIFALRASPAVGTTLFYRCYLNTIAFVYRAGGCDDGPYLYRRPLGYAYQTPAPGRVPLYACGANNQPQMLVTNTSDCAVFRIPLIGLVGYGLPADNWNRSVIYNRP